MSDNPYESPPPAASQALADPWPRWALRTLCALFILFGLAGMLAAMTTAANVLTSVMLGTVIVACGIMSLLSAGLAIYGAVRNYRIGVKQIEINRELQNEVFNTPSR